MLYVVAMDNPDRDDDAGLPTRVRIVGPFAKMENCAAWVIAENNPRWQCVDLLTPTVQLVRIETPVTES